MSRKVPAGNTSMLETERLVLRPLSSDEVRSLQRISNEPDVPTFVGCCSNPPTLTIYSPSEDLSSRSFGE